MKDNDMESRGKTMRDGYVESLGNTVSRTVLPRPVRGASGGGKHPLPVRPESVVGSTERYASATQTSVSPNRGDKRHASTA